MRTSILYLGTLATCLLSCLVAGQADCTYSNSSLVSFASQLGFNGSLSQEIVDNFQGFDCGPNSIVTATTRAGLACYVAQLYLSANPSTNAYIPSFLDESSPQYINRTEVNWSDDCWQKAHCIIAPTSTNDVAQLLRIIKYTQSKFAVRSGGHNPNVGFSNVNESGILIDTVNLNQTTLSSDNTTLSVGPGLREGQAYKMLDERGYYFNGGKDPSPALGGLLIGGGITFFASNYGIAANGIKNVEVVLSNSTVVNANETSNSDLWWAVKGGGPNYGIITRYDVEVVPAPKIWYEYRLYNLDQSEALLQAIVQYQDAAENDNNSSIVYQAFPTGTLLGFIYQQPVEWPSVFQMFKNITFNTTTVNSTIGTPYQLIEATAGAESEAAISYAGLSIGLRPDFGAYNESYAIYLEIANNATKTFNGTVTYGIQPVTSNTVNLTQRNGGVPLGLAEGKQTWFVTTVQWDNSSYYQVALEAIEGIGEAVRQAAVKRNISLPFHFMNDASSAQNVFKGYGDDNLARLRNISATYDPDQIFQNLQNGGFLLSRSV